MRFIKANFPADKADAVIEIINNAKPLDWSMDSGYGRYEKAVEILVSKGDVCNPCSTRHPIGASLFFP